MFRAQLGAGANDSILYGVALRPDGRIVAAGTADDAGGQAEVAGLQLGSDGNPDPGFGTAGVKRHQLGLGASPASEVLDVELLPDGRLVVTGDATTTARSVVSWVTARLGTTGELDPAFGPGGVARAGVAGNAQSVDVVRIADVRLVVTGIGKETTTSEFGAMLARFTGDGQPNPGFDAMESRCNSSASRARPPPSGSVVQGDGRILAAGMTQDPSGFNPALMMRERADGSFDPSFGPKGSILRQLGAPVAANDGSILTAISHTGDGNFFMPGVATPPGTPRP